MNQAGFSPADILTPKGVDMTKWSVVACDQYTSEPDYWERVRRTVGEAPSALHLVYPEVWLDAPDRAKRIEDINRAMRAYLDGGVFETLLESYVYIERTLAPGRTRRGLLGKIDLERYDYTAGSQSPIRPTEGTVEGRLPPRVQIRQDAPLEAPHVLLLLDDARRTVIEPLGRRTGSMRPLYRFNLMEGGGEIRGWLCDEGSRRAVDAALEALSAEVCGYGERFAPGKGPLFIAVGDGNHSLATAKACFERLKRTLPREEWERHPARYALVELCNVHDEALTFEPIHRALFGVDPDRVLAALRERYQAADYDNGGQSFEYVTGSRRGRLYLEEPSSALPVGTLQEFLDDYLREHGGRLDYIHGSQVVERLCKQPDTIGFLLPAMRKNQLFSTVLTEGALPRKTFSMGEAHEKRYYLECRKIR